MSLLIVENLKISIEGREIVENLNFQVEKNETLAIIGPNGAGKTILFRALLGLLTYKGKIQWENGVKIGYVPQKISIEKDFPLSIGDFFDLQDIDIKNAKVLLRLMGVGMTVAGEDKYPNIFKEKIGALSSGEFQRVLIASALASNPDVLLFDEPTAGVDMGNEDNVYKVLSNLQKIKGFAVVLISHDLNVVNKYADKVLCLNKKQVCYGHPIHALTTESLQLLYGEEAVLHHHIKGQYAHKHKEK